MDVYNHRILNIAIMHIYVTNEPNKKQKQKQKHYMTYDDPGIVSVTSGSWVGFPGRINNSILVLVGSSNL